MRTPIALSLLLLTLAGCPSSESPPAPPAPATAPASAVEAERVWPMHAGSREFESEIEAVAVWPSLDNPFMPDGRIDVRVYHSNGLLGPQALRVRWDPEGSTAEYLELSASRGPYRYKVRESKWLTPIDGWDVFWDRFHEYEPADSVPFEHAAGTPIPDGFSLYYERASEKGHVRFLYSNPAYTETSTARQVERFHYFLADQFQLTRFVDAEFTYPHPIADGKVVLVRRGDAVGAFIMHDQKDNTHDKDTATYSWVYRTDGKTWLDARFVAASSGTSTIVAEKRFPGTFVRFGPFDLGWNAARDGFGVLRYPVGRDEVAGASSTRIAVTEHERLTVDADPDKWNFIASYREYRGLDR